MQSGTTNYYFLTKGVGRMGVGVSVLVLVSVLVDGHHHEYCFLNLHPRLSM